MKLKHVRAISKQPQVASANFQAKMDFLVALTDQIIGFIFEKTN